MNRYSPCNGSWLSVWSGAPFTSIPYREPVVFQWYSSGNPVCLELRPQCTLECHWTNNCWWLVCFQCVPVVFWWVNQWHSSGIPVYTGWSSVHWLRVRDGLTLIQAWISNHMPSKMWNEISYPFPNFNCCTVEVWEWINNFISHFKMDVIAYPCWD